MTLKILISNSRAYEISFGCRGLSVFEEIVSHDINVVFFSHRKWILRGKAFIQNAFWVVGIDIWQTGPLQVAKNRWRSVKVK